ncbi:hypothetical protein ACFLRF_06515, partial [Candidatus Altiarchaeota archaeon]
MGKKQASLDPSVLKPAFLAMLAAILIFGASSKTVRDSVKDISWDGIPWASIDPGAAIYNATVAVTLLSAYTILFLAAYKKIQGKKLKYGDDLKAAIIFTVIALAMTYPLLLVYTSHVPGDGRDSIKSMWNLWTAKERITRSHDPYHTDMIFHPQGTSLILDSYPLLAGIISIPAQSLSGLIPAYNTMMLLALIWSAFGAYKLTEYLTKDRNTAIICGLAFGFSPYH